MERSLYNLWCFIRDAPGVTVEKLMELSGLSDRTVWRRLGQLKKGGYIVAYDEILSEDGRYHKYRVTGKPPGFNIPLFAECSKCGKRWLPYKQPRCCPGCKSRKFAVKHAGG